MRHQKVKKMYYSDSNIACIVKPEYIENGNKRAEVNVTPHEYFKDYYNVIVTEWRFAGQDNLTDKIFGKIEAFGAKDRTPESEYFSKVDRKMRRTDYGLTVFQDDELDAAITNKYIKLDEVAAEYRKKWGLTVFEMFTYRDHFLPKGEDLPRVARIKRNQRLETAMIDCMVSKEAQEVAVNAEIANANNNYLTVVFVSDNKRDEFCKKYPETKVEALNDYVDKVDTSKELDPVEILGKDKYVRAVRGEIKGANYLVLNGWTYSKDEVFIEQGGREAEVEWGRAAVCDYENLKLCDNGRYYPRHIAVRSDEEELAIIEEKLGMKLTQEIMDKKPSFSGKREALFEAFYERFGITRISRGELTYSERAIADTTDKYERQGILICRDGNYDESLKKWRAANKNNFIATVKTSYGVEVNYQLTNEFEAAQYIKAAARKEDFKACSVVTFEGNEMIELYHYDDKSTVAQHFILIGKLPGGYIHRAA